MSVAFWMLLSNSSGTRMTGVRNRPRARGDHLFDVPIRHRAVLHLEPDVVVMLRDLAIELHVKLADRVA